MDSTSRATDEVRATRSSMNRLAASLESSTAQTGDVITVLMPAAADDPELSAKLLSAARQQRTYLQSIRDVAKARSRSEVNAALDRARAAGRSASKLYAELRTSNPEIAGLLPSSPTFNLGSLTSAARSLNKKQTKKSSSSQSSSSGASRASSSGSSSGGSGGGNCGGGVSVNSNTSCPFGRNVAATYQASGGDSVIDVYSPVTGTTYTMYCSHGIPTVCTGGNNARVEIR